MADPRVPDETLKYYAHTAAHVCTTEHVIAMARELLALREREAGPVAWTQADSDLVAETINRYSALAPASILADWRNLAARLVTALSRFAHPPSRSPEAQGKWVPTKEQIISALQTSWDEWVADTGCIPDDFTLYTRGKVSFQAGNWARQVADQLLSAAPDPQPEAQAGKFVSDEVLRFLSGSGPLDGLWFGDKADNRTPYWWRKYLPAAPESEGRKL